MTTQAVAIITGAASGIGCALAQRLAQQQIAVVLADIDQLGLERAATSIGARGGAAHPLRLDVTDSDAVQAAVAQTVERFGRLDYMVNNAGIGGTLDMRQASIAQWNRIVSLNLMGVVHGVQAAYPVMIRQGAGHIVNTASIGGLIPVPGQTLYNTTKYAIVGLSHTLRSEAARYGIRVSVVCPGPVQSAIWGTPILGDRVQAQAPRQAISAESAAEQIWRGIQANAAMIIFPRQDRLAALLYRIHPGLLRAAFARHMRAVLPP